MQQIKLWKIESNAVKKIKNQPLDYEDRLEKWLIEDITILSDKIAIIGTQVPTSYNKIIDILAINSLGELIIIELKRDKTYREVISQVLDYATWVKELDYDSLNTILTQYGKTPANDIGDFFAEKFHKEPDEIEFNSDHKMLIVGSEVDDSTMRIINYLSNEPYSVNINAVNFNYFKDKDGQEFLAQSFVMPEKSIMEESKSKQRKRAPDIRKVLFDNGKLGIGDKVYFKPALDNGVKKNDLRISAEIVNLGPSCLKRPKETTIYSFSGLRKQITKELKLDIKANWGYGVRFDWVTDKGESLSDLVSADG